MNANTVILLVEPENPDNIGAVCRAMKNMGLFQLRLVKPPMGWRKKAEKMAMHSHDVLKKAVVYKTAVAAVEDCQLVIGTSRRGGPKRGFAISFSKAIQKIKKTRLKYRVTVMFGKESKGLDNDSLDLCDWVAAIPTYSGCPSINLAQSVMIMAFSLYEETEGRPRFTDRKTAEEKEMPLEAYLPKKEWDITLDHLEKALTKLGYVRDRNRTVPRIRASFNRLFKRSGLLASEAQMFKGLARRILERTTGADE